MTSPTTLTCACKKVSLELQGPPIASVECLCNSCREAGERLETLPGAPKIVDGKGATPLVLQRKDRFRIVSGGEHLRAFRLSREAATRRVVAGCCNTPMFLEFTNGHWVSVYGLLWPEGRRPALEMRTMVGDLDDPSSLPADVPNLTRHSPAFYARLLGAWIRMRLRTPKLAIDGELNA